VWLPTFRQEARVRSVGSVTVYLLETYLARSQSAGLTELDKRLRQAAQGQPVRYLRTTYLPEDETCFHYIEAPTAAAAERFAEHAQLAIDRVLEAENVTVSSSNSKEES
jgi:hypothetical protein